MNTTAAVASKTSALKPTASITIRPAYADDELTVRRLAALDSAPALRLPALLAEVDGDPRAAISLRDGRVVADPFEYTTELVVMLRVRAAQHERRAEIRLPAAPSARRLPLRSHA